MAFSLMEGNEALVRGALASGCNFFAGYPITPASTILNLMVESLPGAGGICLQGEDEIASMGMCLGASMGGMKVLTATSGPGISLCSEQISFALGSEIPIVIVDVQRLGPSTGSATRGADGDIQFLRWGCSGGLPVIVLSPTDVMDCYLLISHAFNFAEQFRCPVFIASNKEIGMTRESVDLSNVKLPQRVERKKHSGSGFLPFAAAFKNKAPDFLPIGGDIIVRHTSSTHGADGYITTDPKIIQASQDRLFGKISSVIDGITIYDFNQVKGANTLVLTYGVTSRAARQAVMELLSIGVPVSQLTLKTLWPVPVEVIKNACENVKHVLVVEMNLGQYVREIHGVVPEEKIKFLGQMNGKLITPRQIIEAVMHG